MYAYIQGTVAEVGENTVVLDVGGVGYELNATASAVSSCAVGAVRRLPAYLVVKEDEMSLYGFADMREKNMFLRLIAVSGIGPKLALSVLGGMSVRELSRNIASGNSAALSSIKGVGKRTAERIVVELKDKITESCDGAGDAVQKAAPVLWDKQIVEHSAFAQAVVVNSGIANACTGRQGLDCCEAEAK